jgi:hypothetical protein
MIKAILLKPLDGRDIGAEAEFSEADFNELQRLGAVKRASATITTASGEAPKAEAAAAEKPVRAAKAKTA